MKPCCPQPAAVISSFWKRALSWSQIYQCFPSLRPPSMFYVILASRDRKSTISRKTRKWLYIQVEAIKEPKRKGARFTSKYEWLCKNWLTLRLQCDTPPSAACKTCAAHGRSYDKHFPWQNGQRSDKDESKPSRCAVLDMISLQATSKSISPLIRAFMCSIVVCLS